MLVWGSGSGIGTAFKKKPSTVHLLEECLVETLGMGNIGRSFLRLILSGPLRWILLLRGLPEVAESLDGISLPEAVE